MEDHLKRKLMDFKSKTDKELVALTLKDRDMFVHIVQRYEKKLLRYVLRLSYGRYDLAEDILQEALIKIYRNLNDFDDDLSFSSWAYRITHNEAINHLKKAGREKTIPLETGDDNYKNLIDLLESDINIEQKLRQKDIITKVQNIISMLSPKYKDVLILKYLEEKDYNEISDILQKPIGTVGTLINRAKAQFKLIAEKNNLI